METQNSYRILVVDDEQDLCEIVKFNLEMEGYTVDCANSAEEALRMLEIAGQARDEGVQGQQPTAPHSGLRAGISPSVKGQSSMFNVQSSMFNVQRYDLLLLDVMMSGMSGFSLAHRLKTDVRSRHIPIIFLTARDTENDVITGLNLGADDYIAKPFSLRELMARVGAVLRRTGRSRIEPAMRTIEPAMRGSEHAIRGSEHAMKDSTVAEGLVIDDWRKVILIDGVEAQLSRTEFDLLRLLITETGHVFSRQELIDRVWPRGVVVTERTVDVCVTRLRKKMGHYATRLVTKPGFGYSYTS